jgi:importin-7
LAIECIELGVGHEAPYQKCVLPYAERLLTGFLFRRLRFSSEDEELWTMNPEEYVRKLTDPRGDLFNPKLISMGLIVTMCHPRKPFHSSDLLMSFVNFLLVRLGTLAEAFLLGQAPAAAAAPEYDGCLFAIAQLKKLLAHGHQIDDGRIEWLLSTYVAPMLSCPIGYLRAKAVYILSLFKDTHWSSPEVYPSIVKAVIPLLQDKDVPVRIQTCVCLSRFIRMDAARDVITPQIGAIVEQYFQIMRLMDNDGVVRTLRKTVVFYGDALAQWATDLCRMLVQHFMTVHSQLSSKHKAVEESTGGDGDDNDDVVDSLLAADELMETLRTLVQTVPRDASARATMASMQDTLAPLLQMLMSVRHGTNLGFMDAALHLLTTVVSQSLEVTTSFWMIAALVFEVGLDVSFLDYAEHLVAPLDNFLSVDPNGFLENMCCNGPDGTLITCGEMTVHLCNTIANNGTSFHHLSTIPKLIDAVLLHGWSCGNNSEKTQWVSTQLIQLSIQILSTRGGAMPPTLQALFADNILVGVVTAPLLCLTLLSQTGAPQFVMESIVALMSSNQVRPNLRVFDRKVLVMSLASLLQTAGMNAAQQPLAESLAEIVAGSSLVGVCAADEVRLMNNEVQYHQKRISGKLDDSEDDEGWDDSSDDDDETEDSGSDLGDDFDDDMGSEANEDDIKNDAQYSATISQASKMRAAALGEDFDDDQENFLDDEEVETPMDEKNVWQTLLDVAGRYQSQGATPLVDANTLSVVEEASHLFAKCLELRKTNRTHPNNEH